MSSVRASHSPAADAALIKEAADWAMTLHYGTPTDADRRAFEHWRQRSAAHEAAWARAQAVFHTFQQVPADIGKQALDALDRTQSRRRSLHILGALLVAAPAGWLAWRQMPERPADFVTVAGERKALALPDGSRLVLNSASAVDITFTASERRIRLRAGEILVTTRPDTSPRQRPFLVDTPQGVVRALGTRFSVRLLNEESSRVAVFEHAVELRPLSGAQRILRAGEQADFAATRINQPLPVDQTAALWENGMLLAKSMRLDEVIAELARHYPGVLDCDPAVANLRVTGALSLDDTAAALRLLVGTLPLRVEQHSGKLTVRPRG